MFPRVVKTCLLALQLLAGCVSSPSRGAEAPLDKIRPWNFQAYQAYRFQPFPRILSYRSGSKELLYLATKHADWKNSNRLIERAISAFQPEIILIEGIHRAWGQSPSNWDTKMTQNFEREGFEGYFAYSKARAAGIPFLGAEPGRMKDFTSGERDQAVLKLLTELLAQYKKVMVVYGAGHFYQQELALNEMFGGFPVLVE